MKKRDRYFINILGIKRMPNTRKRIKFKIIKLMPIYRQHWVYNDHNKLHKLHMAKERFS